MDVTLDILTEQVIAIDVIQGPATEISVVTGVPGTDGAGVVPGGTTGQVLVKNSDANFDTKWDDPTVAAGVATVNGQTGTVVLDQDDIADGTTAKQYTATEKTKLAGIASGAQVNTVSSVAGKTGAVTLAKADVGLGSVDNTADTAKPISTATQTALNAKADSSAVSTALAGKANTIHTHAESDITGLATDLAAKAPLNSPAFTGTPTGITKSHVGLGNVDNTADTAKPVSTAQQTALNLKAPLASPAFTGTPTGITKAHVGLGNVDNTADTAKPVSTAQQTALDARMVWADGSTSTNARPSTSSKVIWVGGTTQPVNMTTGDIWIKA